MLDLQGSGQTHIHNKQTEEYRLFQLIKQKYRQ